MKLYVAGPMRGYKDFNFPAFLEAARRLRKAGHDVFCPAERDLNHYGEGINKSETGDLADTPRFNLREALGADLAWICAEADGVVTLTGWEDSKGACAEVATANALSLPIWEMEV